jgi:hypothetical protein
MYLQQSIPNLTAGTIYTFTMYIGRTVSYLTAQNLYYSVSIDGACYVNNGYVYGGSLSGACALQGHGGIRYNKVSFQVTAQLPTAALRVKVMWYGYHPIRLLLLIKCRLWVRVRVLH